MERHEDRVRTDGLDDSTRSGQRSPAGGDGDRLAVVRTDPVGQHRVQFDEGAGVRERADPTGLRAGLILRQHPPGGEVDRVVDTDRFGRTAVIDGNEASSAVGRRERFTEEARRAGVIRTRARPEHPMLIDDPVIRDARVVRLPTSRCAGQFLEDHLRLCTELHRRFQPRGKAGHHIEVRTHACRRRHGSLAQDHPAFEVGHRAGLFGPLRHGQDHVGHGRGLGENQVGDDEEVEGCQAFGDVRGIGSRDDDVGAEHQQRLGATVRAQRVKQLVRRFPPTWQGIGSHTPHPSDVLTCGRVVDHPIARQLIGLLAVLAAALAVALTGQAPIPGVRLARQAQRQRHIDPRYDGRGALRVLLGTARGQHHDTRRPG